METEILIPKDSPVRLLNAVVFVTGKGRRKSALQKAVEAVEDWLDKWKRYTRDVHICGDRNSYSKTDHDATFLRMKS